MWRSNNLIFKNVSGDRAVDVVMSSNISRCGRDLIFKNVSGGSVADDVKKK